MDGMVSNSTSQKMTCKAVIDQGANKGKQCWRPSTENGYCGKHQSDFLLEKGKSEGLRKCSKFRCLNMIPDGKYCQTCKTKRDEERTHVVMCKGLITQGKNKGQPCDKKASCEEGYCGKHMLNITLEKTKEEGKRICDDGKRACKNYTEDGKLKCEECLTKTRIKEQGEHAYRKEMGLCLGCGCELESLTRGFRREVQRCEPCYEKLREIEFNRPDRSRNYKAEAKANLDFHYRRYHTGAYKRNIQFDLTIEQFGDMVTLPCHYCGSRDELEVVGVDRVNNDTGYTIQNTVPCCEKCNIMKRDLTVDEFIDQIVKIYNNFKDKETVSFTQEKKPSYIKPRKIIDIYNRGKLDEYIELCVKDERSPLFIEKLRFLKTVKLSEREVRNYIRSCLCSDTNRENIQSRQRISKKELFGYLEMKNVDMCIRRYSEVHGTPEGFEEDIRNLVRFWNTDNEINFIEFNKVLVKYQNKRAGH